MRVRTLLAACSKREVLVSLKLERHLATCVCSMRQSHCKLVDVSVIWLKFDILGTMDFVTLPEVRRLQGVPPGLPVQAGAPLRVSKDASKGSKIAGLSAAGAVLLVKQWRKSGASGARASASEIKQAVSEGRMITLEEEAVRKTLAAVFLVLYVWQAFLVINTGEATLSIAGSSYSTLSLLFSNAVGFGGSGLLSL